MEINKILSADIIDLVFEGRIKEYGAYDLRKTYNKRISYALIVTFTVCILFFVVSLVAKAAKKKPTLLQGPEVIIINPGPKEKKPETPPPPPPPKQEPPKVEMAKFTPPKIVKDEEVKEDDVPPEVDKLDDVAIGLKNIEGEKYDGTIAPIVEEAGTGKVEAPKDEIDYNGVFSVVQIPAEYPGGLAAWAKYLERNLNSNVPVDNGAPSGRYTVVLSFIVDKTGGISEINAENDPGYGTKEEAIRVLKKGGGWKPAVQNGRNVIYRHRQSITFQVSEE